MGKVGTKDNLADLGAKIHSATEFARLRELNGLLEFEKPLDGIPEKTVQKSECLYEDGDDAGCRTQGVEPRDPSGHSGTPWTARSQFGSTTVDNGEADKSGNSKRLVSGNCLPECSRMRGVKMI